MFIVRVILSDLWYPIKPPIANALFMVKGIVRGGSWEGRFSSFVILLFRYPSPDTLKSLLRIPNRRHLIRISLPVSWCWTKMLLGCCITPLRFLISGAPSILNLKSGSFILNLYFHHHCRRQDEIFQLFELPPTTQRELVVWYRKSTPRYCGGGGMPFAI